MKKLKNLANEIFIEGLSGMAAGLFATLIIGTIIQQIGSFIPGTVGELIYIIGKIIVLQKLTSYYIQTMALYQLK